MTIAKLEGAFTGTGASSPIAVAGGFNFRLAGTFVATVKLERSFDDGTSWAVVSKNIDGQEAAYTAAVDAVGNEPEAGVTYRWNCTAFTSGQIDYRISQ